MQSFQDRILKVANQYLKEKYGYSFEYRIVGSAGRGLVTERIGSNKGHDLDYNLIIDEPSPLFSSVVDVVPSGYDHPVDAKRIKDQFREAFNYAVEGTEFDFPEDSSSVLTIKRKDRKNNRVVYSADLAIVYYDRENVLHMLEHYKSHDTQNSDGYGFQIKDGFHDFENDLDEILDFLDGGWDLIAEEYLKLKNSNEDPNKKSFILFVEAVHNVRNNYDQEIYDEMDREGYFDDDDE